MRYLVDSTGNLVNTLTYTTFGDLLTQTNAALQPRHTYTAREFDAAADLAQYRARWYDPTARRFTAEDPIGFAAGDTNVSRYVGNASTMLVDPSGMEEEIKITIGGFIPKRLGQWMREPGSADMYLFIPTLRRHYFNSNGREIGEPGTYKVGLEVTIKNPQWDGAMTVGPVDLLTSPTKRLLVTPGSGGPSGGQEIEEKTAPIKDKDGRPFDDNRRPQPTIIIPSTPQLGRPPHAIINLPHIKGNYPFMPDIAPNIDVDAAIEIIPTEDGLVVVIVVLHDEFPDYEIIVTGPNGERIVVDDYLTDDDGPGANLVGPPRIPTGGAVKFPIRKPGPYRPLGPPEKVTPPPGGILKPPK